MYADQPAKGPVGGALPPTRHAPDIREAEIHEERYGYGLGQAILAGRSGAPMEATELLYEYVLRTTAIIAYGASLPSIAGGRSLRLPRALASICRSKVRSMAPS